MTCTHCNDTGSKGGLYLDCAHCDDAGILAIPGARQRMEDAAPVMRALLAEYLDPVLPRAFKSELEWKKDFDTRVRVALLRIAGPQALTKARAA